MQAFLKGVFLLKKLSPTRLTTLSLKRTEKFTIISNHICTAPDLFGIDKIPKSVKSEEINGKLFTEIEEIINEEFAKMPDWKINAQLVQIFADNGKYDTHGINFAMSPIRLVNRQKYGAVRTRILRLLTNWEI